MSSNVMLPHMHYRTRQTSTTMAEENQSQLHHGHKEDEMKKSWSSESLANFPMGKNCVCSPTNHSGSFRCRHHRQPFFSDNLPSPVSAHHKPSDSGELLQENKWIANLLAENLIQWSVFQFSKRMIGLHVCHPWCIWFCSLIIFILMCGDERTQIITVRRSSVYLFMKQVLW